MARSIKNIVADMALNAPSKALFDEAYSAAQRAGQTLDSFFQQNLPPHIAAHWRACPDFPTWVNSKLGPSGRGWFYKGQDRAELVMQSVEIVEDNFIAWRDSSGSTHAAYQDYRIVDHSRRLVEPLMAAGEDRERDITRAVAPIIAKDGYHIEPQEAMRIWKLAQAHGRLEKARPKICAQPGENVWCLHRIDVAPDACVDFPETQAFLDRLNDPVAFAAFLYGVYSGRYVGRQILWLKGSGSDGKSTFMKAFCSLFGNAAGSVDWNTLKESAAYAGALFVNKRFVYVPDNNNPELLNTGLFKSLSDPGTDPVVINHKYGKMYSTELEAHTAVLSNFAPSIRNETHSLSRALFLTILPRDMTIPADKSITERFIAELPGFLAFGEACYEEVCFNNTEIHTNEAAQADIAERLDETSERWEALLQENFVIDADAKVDNLPVYRLLKDARLSDYEVSEFRAYLKRTYGVVWRQVVDPATGKRPRKYLGLRLRKATDDRKAILGPTLVSDKVA